MRFEQIGINGGHLVVMEAEVGDGHLQVETRWQHVYGEDLEVAGSMLVQRTAWINGHIVLDPDYAKRLWAEAMRQQP